MKKENKFKVTAEPSSDKNPESGKIKVKMNGSEKTIPAVVFSSEKARKLLEIAEEVSSKDSEKIK
ncbi:MAG: hypothetical protein ACQER7_11175 [Bacteroidota bacterium]